jgi:YidC/Oxa1 family membrane protein insertase
MPILASNFIQNILQPLISVFESILVFFHDHVGFSWGLSIVAMTIVVRALMLPIAIRQFRSMYAMQRLKPQIDQLRKRFGDDKQRLNQEMMTFYKENKVNPFGACLPVVLQLPIFVSLFYMLRTDLRHDICPGINPAGVSNPKPCGATEAASFLGIPDITDKATGTVLIVMIVLYVGSQLMSSLLMMQQQPGQDKNQRMIMLVLPFIFVPFVVRFPAGLLVYWITTNFWTMGQQTILRQLVGHKMHVEAEASAAAGGGGPGGVTAKAPSSNGASDGGGKRGGGLFGALVERAQQATAAQQAQQAQQAAGSKTSGGGGGSGASKGSGGSEGSGAPAPKPATRGKAGTPAPKPASTGGPPPRSPRKKKKRSGRRR